MPTTGCPRCVGANLGGGQSGCPWALQSSLYHSTATAKGSPTPATHALTVIAFVLYESLNMRTSPTVPEPYTRTPVAATHTPISNAIHNGVEPGRVDASVLHSKCVLGRLSSASVALLSDATGPFTKRSSPTIVQAGLDRSQTPPGGSESSLGDTTEPSSSRRTSPVVSASGPSPSSSLASLGAPSPPASSSDSTRRMSSSAFNNSLAASCAHNTKEARLSNTQPQQAQTDIAPASEQSPGHPKTFASTWRRKSQAVSRP